MRLAPDQKDCMQLIGTWGYTPQQLKEYLQAQRKRARDVDDATGTAMYAAMLVLCWYAETGDVQAAVNASHYNPAPFNKLLKDELKFMLMRGDDFAIGVLSSVYEKCAPYKTYIEAERNLRSDVFAVVAPYVMREVTRFAGVAAEQIMECFVGLDHIGQYLYTEHKRKDFDKIKDTIVSTLERLVMLITRYMDEILACGRNKGDEIGRVVGGLLIDFRDAFRDISRDDILSILDKTPREWTQYAINYGRCMAGFALAVALGYITYDEYDILVKGMREIKESLDTVEVEEEHPEPAHIKTKPKASFGRN